jgi:hypothetical protein
MGTIKIPYDFKLEKYRLPPFYVMVVTKLKFFKEVKK